MASETARVNGVGNGIGILQRHNDEWHDDGGHPHGQAARPVRITHRMVTVDDLRHKPHDEPDRKPDIGRLHQPQPFQRRGGERDFVHELRDADGDGDGGGKQRQRRQPQKIDARILSLQQQIAEGRDEQDGQHHRA